MKSKLGAEKAILFSVYLLVVCRDLRNLKRQWELLKGRAVLGFGHEGIEQELESTELFGAM